MYFTPTPEVYQLWRGVEPFFINRNPRAYARGTCDASTFLKLAQAKFWIYVISSAPLRGAAGLLCIYGPTPVVLSQEINKKHFAFKRSVFYLFYKLAADTGGACSTRFI